MGKHESYIIRPYEAVRLLKHHEQTQKEYSWARQMAALYQAVPIDEDCALNFYRFVTDVFNAGVISGKRDERARRRNRRTITEHEREAIDTFLKLSWGDQLRVYRSSKCLLAAQEAQNRA